MNRFFGGSPAWALLRLAVVCVIVGFVMSALGFHPLSLYADLERLFFGVIEMGFSAVGRAARYLVLGALVVVPIWLLLRLIRMGRGT